jgi:hypothetical protein
LSAPAPAPAPAPDPVRPQASPAIRDLEEQTAVGIVFLGALLRRQLALSLRVAASVVVLLGSQPLLAWFWPGYTQIEVLSVPLPWIVLAVGSYPVMIACGLYYVRHAEAIDHEFSELMES